MTAIDMLPSIGLAALAVFISSVAQVLLKKEASKEHATVLAEYLNPLVIAGYALMLLTTLMIIMAFRVIPLSMGAVLESTSYLYVTIFGVIIFKEKLTLKKAAALLLILIGILLYAAGL